MNLPFFYISSYDPSSEIITLDEDASKHVAQVLRMKPGEQLNLTDGKGNLLEAELIDNNKKKTLVKIKGIKYKEQTARRVSVAISLLKNANRFEWFLEKATEIGVNEITPLLCERTERQQFRYERLKSIMISAMLQSRQVWLPELKEPEKFADYIKTSGETGQLKLIAHCTEAEKKKLNDFHFSAFSKCRILIGPEGDFTGEEISLALQHNYIPVTLGETRLRTETAGIVAAVMMCSSDKG
ncbi:MAG: RsmE family RNA methyltransferase [Chitinophagaceae bacterium]|nr:RsmE family RNA methyltransferase [Chitinophagaceae bacterium]